MNTNSRHHKHGQSGFTAAEMLMALALFSFVGYLSFNFFVNFSKQSQSAMSNISADIDALLLQRSIRFSIIRSEVSMNLVQMSDNDGLNFYTHIADAPCKNVCDRKFSLDGSPGRDSYIFLHVPKGDAGYQTYYPAHAYDIGENNDETTSGSLAFVSANGNPSNPIDRYLERRLGYGIPQKLLQYNSIKSRDDVLLLFHSLVELRAPVGGVVDMSIAPRKANLVAHLDTSNFEVNPVNPDGILDMSHPLDSTITFDGPSYPTFDNASGLDLFLRTLPPIGGVASYAGVREVKLSRYHFKANNPAKQEDNEVYLQDWDPVSGNWEAEGFLIGKGLHSIDFYRPRISETLIRVKIWDKPPLNP